MARLSAEEARAAREAKLNALQERLSGAVEALVSGEDWRRALEFAARFRSRSFNNTLLIYTQHGASFEAGRVPEPMPSYVAGYRQWQGLGRQVVKGQPGYTIFAPVTGRFVTATPQDAESWRRLGKGEKPRPGEIVRSKMVGAKPAYVWDPLSRESTPSWWGSSEHIASQGEVAADDLHRGAVQLAGDGLQMAAVPSVLCSPSRYEMPADGPHALGSRRRI